MDRKQFEEWFKTTLSYAIFEDSNVWKVDLYAFNEPTNSYLHSGVQAAFESYQHQQAKVEELQKRVDSQQKLLGIYRVLAEDQLDNCAENLIARINELEQALKGEG
ncbi:hypothetical protein V8P92_02120 [Acinetobacter baumannii]